MKIYTKTGDEGETGLLGDARVSKTDPIIESIGAVDELNSAIGMAAVAAGDVSNDLGPILRTIQSRLFDVGAELAQAQEINRTIRSVGEEDIRELELSIDKMEAGLAPLRNFILPGGGEAAARLHMARSVCRRAEREVLRLNAQAGLRTELLVFLNRLSDWLFVAARHANACATIDDTIWETKP